MTRAVRLGIVGLIVTAPWLILVAYHVHQFGFRATHCPACPVSRSSVRELDLGLAIVQTCNAATIAARETVRVLAASPRVGLALADRDLRMVALCGGDRQPLEAGLARGDPAAVAAAVQVLADDWYLEWCRGCPMPAEAP